MAIAETLSPNGGYVAGRNDLAARFRDRLSVNTHFSRKMVSYQGNRNVPGLRWMKYKEAFSRELVAEFLDEENPESVFDPFAGICTTPLVAAGNGCEAKGIEIMPVGVSAGSAIAEAANGLLAEDLNRLGNVLLDHIRGRSTPENSFSFPHVRITAGAFPEENEVEIAKARTFLAGVADKSHKAILDFACMSVLEESSYTRKDGQYLRWDQRADRPLRSSVDLGEISRFSEALEKRLLEIAEDMDMLKAQYGGRYPDLITGSSLELLKDIPNGAFDMVVTSPPYANRYDYTRTYALELAWLNYNQADFSALRQSMLSATVENRGKLEWLRNLYGNHRNTLDGAIRMFAEQEAVHEVLQILEQKQEELSNRNILRLIEQYVFEMAVIVSELGRVVRPGGVVIMVNDNVQYHGEELPIDFILSDFAEQVGFTCSNIWKLARGKGNSSQQMARFGRKEIRKCVYKWIRNGD